MLGINWCLGFEERHRNITFRNVSNIQADRVAITEQQFNECTQYSENTIFGISEANIFNFDESNLTDNSKSKKNVNKMWYKIPSSLQAMRLNFLHRLPVKFYRHIQFIKLHF